MMNRRENGRNRLSFSQRVGEVTLPDAMKLGNVSRQFRAALWRVVYKRIKAETNTFWGDTYDDDSSISAYIALYQEKIREVYYDEVKRRPSAQLRLMKQTITESSYHDVLTLIEFFLRLSVATKDNKFRQILLRLFELTPIAYFVDNRNIAPTTCPRQDQISGETVAAAMMDIRKGGLSGPEKHLTKAAEFINEGRYSDSIVQSAHSIESVARNIAPDDCKTLGPALKSLERNGILNHPSLREAFSKLYGYTSDKQGLRHAILKEGGRPPDVDEAVFFYGACACFTAYLTKKSRQIKEDE